jgi:flagellar biosynthesis/type III secretory pathway M-ring protein FliF/YscJ
MDLLNRAYSQLYQRYRAMTPGARVASGLLAVVALASLGYLLTHRVSPPEAELMPGVSVTPSQVPAMVAALADANLKGYEVRGTKIYVPRGQEADYLAALAKANALPPTLGTAQRAAVSGGSLWDIGSQRERERMKVAKQEDLQKAICMMPGIENAWVGPDEFQPGGFQEKVLTALVIVKPSGMSQLDEKTVSAIRRMMPGAFAGLKPENVTVADLSGRTWCGNPEEGGGGDNLYVSLKRIYEQDLKAKILNALGFIPNATVEVSVEVEKESLGPTPVSARVSVGVPVSYFKKIWLERNPGEPGLSPKAPNPSALDQIRVEVSTEIQRHVAPLLPPTAGVKKATDLVTVTTFQDIPAPEPPAPSFGQNVLSWVGRSWGMLSIIGLALAGLLVLRSIARAGPTATARTVSVNHRTDDDADQDEQVDAPRRRFRAAGLSPREELSAIVENDPETAANVLRSWIGQGV